MLLGIKNMGIKSLKCQPCCAEKAQDVKEAAKKPGEHRRGLTISAAVVIVAIGIYLVRPAQFPIPAEDLPDSRKVSADTCSGSAWDPLHQPLSLLQTPTQSIPPLANLCLRHRPSLQSYVRDAKRSLKTPCQSGLISQTNNRFDHHD